MSEPQMVDPATVKRGQIRRNRLARNKRFHEFDRKLITPEGAELTLKLASAGQRAGAFLIDWMIIIIAFLTIIYGAVNISNSLGIDGDQIVGAIAMLLIFALRNFYFIFFEIGRRAATPGKRLLGLRVASRNGGQLTSNAILARNFVREVETFIPLIYLFSVAILDGVQSWISFAVLIWSGIFLFLPAMNKDKLRLGDIIAGTWVIRTPKMKLLGDISKRTQGTNLSTDRYDFSPTQLDAYGIHELHILEDILRRSNPEVNQSVADRIRTKIGWIKGADETDTEFLQHYYAGLRRNLEQKLLLGKRKTDKFDK